MKDFFEGVKLLGQGLKRVGTHPKRLFLGLIPAFLSLVLFTILFAVLIIFLGDIIDVATWYARDWSSALRGMVEVLTGVAILGIAGLLAILSYTAVTLAIGDPFYEAIAESIEDELGGVPDEVNTPFFAAMMRSLRDSGRLILTTLVIAIPLFVVGLIPVIGQVVGPVLGALVGGWFLSVEVTGVAFYRRGLGLKERRRLLRTQRKTAIGFGVAIFLCFLIPLGGVLIMPAAVAGGTLLTRKVFGLPIN
ncbi:MAG TPA: EI24 domain-containing protein [Candidatus Limnocylindrales bacterium]|nr:EI24 domain-containing protein [Candidatus Limnocylindrales bacterium]